MKIFKFEIHVTLLSKMRKFEIILLIFVVKVIESHKNYSKSLKIYEIKSNRNKTKQNYIRWLIKDRGSVNAREVCANLLFDKTFGENCINYNESILSALIGSTNGISENLHQLVSLTF